MPIELADLLPDALAVAVGATAAAIDARRYTIPNWLTFTAVPLGLALNAALGGVDGLLLALAGAAVGLAAFGAFAAFGVIGMGDVKLAAAIGALVRWPLIGPALLYSALAGGVVAMVAAGARRGPSRSSDRRIPYGLAIAAGCAWAVASRYVPALQLI